MTRINKFIVDLRPLSSHKYGGVQTLNRNFIEQIVKNLKNDQKLVFLTTGLGKSTVHLPKLEQYLQRSNISHKHIRMPNLLLNLTLNILNWPKFDKACGLYSKHPKHRSSYLTLDVRPFAVSKKCQSSVYFHDVAFLEQKHSLSLRARLYFWLINPAKIYRKARKVLTNSDFSRRKLRKYFGKKPVQIIYPSVKKPTSFFERKKDSNKMLCIQTLQPRKNIQEIFEFAKANPKLKFLIVGSHQNSFKKTKQAKLPNIEFLGAITDKQKLKLLKQSRALLYTSTYEGFGLPIYEALVQKTPVICHKCKPFTQLFANIKLNYIEDLNDLKIPKKLIAPQKPYRFSLKKSGRSISKLLEKQVS